MEESTGYPDDLVFSGSEYTTGAWQQVNDVLSGTQTCIG
jgi:hypothetical protein